ncbi:hypothetical protein N0V93_004460 [Gnomoniopsis smithogilvyi]|uniref:Uncharacterized protein n=1 Tax=Gnomoniopsis smithogilvyi TaxID=1191159 RepID=A0A9W9CX78_9PEZI|nr:hypothetical protein N0V93_004460 [Gnomoniopsis smithogilvyi]
MRFIALLCAASSFAGSASASWIPERAFLDLESRATDRTWQQSVEYGQQILTAIKAKTAAEATIKGKSLVSTYTSVTDLGTNGWVKTANFKSCFAQDCGFFEDTVYPALGIKVANDIAVQYKNTNEEKYVKTSATVDVGINVPAGLLIADNSLSPTDPTAQIAGKKGTITPLRQWSDVAFLEWLEAAGAAQVKNLKYVIRSLIINAQTKTRIQEALVKSGHKTTPVWKNAAKFAMTSDEGAGLLGSPNGSGVGFLIAGHKQQLGLKTITSVTVWASEAVDLSKDISNESVELFMLFELSDA